MHEPMLSSPASDLQASMRSNFRNVRIELEQVQSRQIGGLAMTIAQARITQDSSGYDEDSGGSTERHTVAYYESSDARFPRFGLRAMELLGGLLGAMGVKGMRFADQPEFARHYLALATQPLRAQAFLDRKVRDWLLAHRGMNMEAGGTGVMVYRSGALLGGEDLEAFARESAELVGLLEQARVNAGSLKEPGELEEVRAFAAQMPRLRASMEKDFLARRVTKADIDAFLGQGLPRRIPSNIAHTCEAAFGMSCLGFGFLVVSALIAYAGPLPMAAIGLLVGVTLLWFHIPRLHRERRLLRRGEPAQARILAVESTRGSEADQEIFKVRAHYEVGGRPRVAQCRAAGKTIKRIAAEGRPARILYDPTHPDRIMVVDALVNSRGD